MEELLSVLKESCPTIDFENGTNLVTDKVIDSIDLVSLISDLEDHYDISIDMEEIEPENFDTKEGILALVEKLQEE